MITLALHRFIVTGAALAIVAYVGVASAFPIARHTGKVLATKGALAAAASSVDMYQTTCSKNVAGATFQLGTLVTSEKAGVVVSIQAIKGKLASHTTDTKGGDKIASPEVALKGGDGVYTILVNKSSAGAVNYSFEAHCETAKETHAGQTNPVLLQNQ
ncbi:hypothetical protein CRENPOLYSF2_680024 [Crenothrix polyspora]|uniref:Uncharacterized protein n=1 Tax=Crenothrix polyspora TaxID=360316 RepID=A0A1R4HIK7_9GAMM|nr:hypothetical protein [Crenothrix polyspora]SJM95710.1 hypothetical protein CRENPOLYSF2_680024 [Crenothrix polyspora]